MSRQSQLEKVLLSLMPQLSTDLPEQLVELANSLLAQSMHRASTLKADEEIARHYACANLACDRLKIQLDLPPIDPRPPIPPRLYKRLYAHLDNILPNSTSTPRTPSGKRTPSSRLRNQDNSPASATRVPSRATPTKERSLAQFRTPSKTATSGTPIKSASKSAVSKGGLDPWIQPTARFICQETNHKKLAPTVLAGMEAIITPAGQKTEDEWVLQNATVLLAAIYFYVIMRVRALSSGEVIDRDGYVPLRKEILALLSRARTEVTTITLEYDDAWSGFTNIKTKDFDNAVAVVNERGWLNEDWYQGIADVVKLTQRSQFDDTPTLDEEEFPEVQVKRADTMFQDKYDFLSETRRDDYRIWKESMLAKIFALSTTDVAMDIDTE